MNIRINLHNCLFPYFILQMALCKLFRYIHWRWIPCYTVIFMVALVYIIIYYWMSTTRPLSHWSFINKHEELAALTNYVENHATLTIILREYEEFANNIIDTSTHLHTIFPDAVIIVVCDEKPYPPLIIPSYVKMLILDSEPFWMSNETHLSNFVRTHHILLWPDGVTFTTTPAANVITKKINYLVQHSNVHAIVWSSSNEAALSCLRLFVDVKHWTLEYRRSLTDICEAVHVEAGYNIVVLMRTNEFLSLPYPLFRPMSEALFIQIALRNWTIDVINPSPFVQNKHFDEHHQWKHRVKQDYRTKQLYQTFSIKLVLRLYDSIADEWYGCSRSTPMCFGTIIDDTPQYLHTGRWTPPCCLKNLRTVALHVINILESQQVRYWLEGGSLLGAARSADIIPWDYDVDIGVYEDDIIKSTQLMKASSEPHQDAKGFIWERAHQNEGNFYRVQYSMSNHLHVDIFPFYPTDKGIMIKNYWSRHRQDMKFPELYLKPLEKLQFLGQLVSVPNHYKEFLELKFGSNVIDNLKYPNGTVAT